MPFQKGQPRPPNAGRRPGSTNKRSADLAKRCEEMGFDPFDALMDVARTTHDPHLRVTCLKELCKYVHPQKRQVDHNVDINVAVAEQVKELEHLADEELIEIVEAEFKRVGSKTISANVDRPVYDLDDAE